MTKQSLVPERRVRDYAHELAFKLARERLAAITDIEEQCRRSAALYLPSRNAASVVHLGRAYLIHFPGGEITFADAAEDVQLRDKILILHYFTRAKGTPLSGKMITYKELSEGINYYPTFFKRTIEPIVANFQDDPAKLIEIAGTMGGRRADYGDAAVTIDAFPRVPLTIVLWRGDGEFPPDGNILFDSTIPDYLPTEDVTILCEAIAWRVVRLARSSTDDGGLKNWR